MTVPAIIYIVLISISLLFEAHDHGKPKEGRNNFWNALIATAIVVGLLVWGGFFN